MNTDREVCAHIFWRNGAAEWNSETEKKIINKQQRIKANDKIERENVLNWQFPRDNDISIN